MILFDNSCLCVLFNKDTHCINFIIMNKNILIFLLFAVYSLVGVSCNQMYNEAVEYASIVDSNAIVINLEDVLDNELCIISDLAYDVKIIPLETTESSIVGDIEQLVFGNQFVYLLDRINNNVLIFDINGSFVKNIARGSGPGEVDRVIDIMFNKYDNHLYIYHHSGINVYSEDGTFWGYKPFLSLVTDIMPTNHGGYLAVASEMQNGSGKYSFYEIDSTFDIKRYLIVDPVFKPEWGISHYIQYSAENNQELLISRPFDNRIFSYHSDDNSIHIKYNFDFGSKALDCSSMSNSIDYETLFKLLEDNSKYSFSGSFFETDNYVCAYLRKGEIYISELFYNKHTTKIRCGYSRYVDIPNSGFVTGVYDNHFVKVLTPESFCNDSVFLSRIKNSSLIISEDKEKLLSSSFDDNPLLVCFKLKDIPADTE